MIIKYLSNSKVKIIKCTFVENKTLISHSNDRLIRSEIYLFLPKNKSVQLAGAVE